MFYTAQGKENIFSLSVLELKFWQMGKKNYVSELCNIFSNMINTKVKL